MTTELTEFEKDKFRRQIRIAGFGEEGQKKLKNSSALVTRVGGLGSPTALYLAVAGIGKLIVAHRGTVKPSNLNRQILMAGDSVGEPRAEQAYKSLKRAAPDVEVEAIPENPDNLDMVMNWVERVDIVLDTTPEFSERYILNEACVRLGKPLIDAGMNDMDAQITTIIPGKTPCLRCIIPEPPDWWDWRKFGVFGALAASLGCFAALEAIKVLTGFGKPLYNRMLSYDGEDMTFKTFKVTRRPGCPVCGHL